MKNLINHLAGISLMVILSAHSLCVKAVNTCTVDSIVLNKTILYPEHDTIIANIYYCGDACACSDIVYANFWDDNLIDSLMHMMWLEHTNPNIIRAMGVIPVFQPIKSYYLRLQDANGEFIDFPTTRIAVIPNSEIILKSENLNGCAGESGRLYIKTTEINDHEIDSFTIKWYKNESLILSMKKASGGGELNIQNFDLGDAGTYKCIIYLDNISVDTTNEITLGYYNLTIPVKPTGSEYLCHNPGEIEYQVETQNQNATFEWNIQPTAAGTTSSVQPDALINWSSDFSGTATITIREKKANCYSNPSEPLEVNITPEAIKPDISYVTVDEQWGHNKIVWEYNINPSIDSFGVYRETNVAEEYALIGTILPYEDLEYIDIQSFPSIQANRYRITAFDSCGNESDPSIIHKTMHLTINSGMNGSWNLIWDGYEGRSFSTYRILRGTKKGELSLLTEIASNLTSFTDLDPINNLAYYQIEIVKNSVKKSTNASLVSKSNVVSTQGTYVDEFQATDLVLIPDYNTKTIKFENFNGTLDIQIYNILGKFISRINNIERGQPVNINYLIDGVYIIKFDAGPAYAIHKLIWK